MFPTILQWLRMELLLLYQNRIYSLDIPHIAHDICQLSNSELLFYVIKFDEMILSNTTPGSPKLPKLLDNATNLDTPYNLITAEELQYNPVKLFFENCIWETKHKEFGYDIKVASTISLIVTEIMRIWLRKGFKFSTKTTFDQFSTKDFSVLEYIDKHSSENINIENLANMCGIPLEEQNAAITQFMHDPRVQIEGSKIFVKDCYELVKSAALFRKQSR
jgi:hypothetical protein